MPKKPAKSQKGIMTPQEHKDLSRLLKKAAEMTDEDEKEVVDFLVDLIPVLQEIQIDLESKKLLPKELCRGYKPDEKPSS